MAREEVDAVYIGSNDFWGFDSDTFNEETNFYGRAWVVPQNKATPKMVEDENLSRCQMYYEIGKTDTHLFTPTQIVFDDEQDVVMIRGNQGRIGQPEITDVKTRVFRVGQDSQRYKNLTSGPKSAEGGRFTVNFIIPDNSEEKTKIKSFIEDLDKEESAEEATVAEAEEDMLGTIGEGNDFGQMGAEEEMLGTIGEGNDFGQMSAEEYGAESLSRINPTVVEGAEDIHGAEDLSVQNVEDGISEEVFGDVGEGNNFGQMMAEEDSYDYTPENFSPYEEPMDYSPYDSEDIVDYFQDLPVVRNFRLGGWSASAIVVGVAALSGAWFSKRRG
ncbi:MAG: hypothetical protein K0U52_10790 [Gammaproteobacteria bacterium]|nr:hypothetical protein [Gammaproteobacteria bacterium]